MKLGGRVHNMCLVLFVVETYGYDFPRTNQGPLRRTLAHSRQHCLDSVQPREAINSSCVDRRGFDTNFHPTLIQIDGSLAYTSL